MKNLLIRMLLGCLAVVCFLDVSAQEKKQVTGTVKDADGNPVAAATIQEKGTANQVFSDAKGVFKISVAPGATLVISTVGFETMEVKEDGTGLASIQLVADSKELTGVIVTALGIKREKKSLGYAVQEVKGETLVSAKEPNLANALSGKVAGLQVIRSSDGPAGSSKIILRGSNSLTGSNQPLIVVDGIPIDNFTGAPDNGYWNRSLDMGNGIADINPEDIESLSVLKGPSAAALYGSRAGNGVILITTKSGKRQNGLGITVSSSIGIENIFTNPEMQNSFGQSTDPSMLTTSWGPKAVTYDNVDNYMQQGVTQNHSVSFQQQFRQSSIYTSFTRDQINAYKPNGTGSDQVW
jgi:TonB-dependent SusC/RagA subfamily outer membrane receptor